jgi:hypothetical protein
MGLEVASGARATCVDARRTIIRTRFRSVLKEASRSGLDGREIRRLLKVELEHPSKRRRGAQRH